MTAQDTVSINVRFPREAHDRLKLWADAHGMSLNTAVLAAVSHLSLEGGMTYAEAEAASLALMRVGYRDCSPDRATGRSQLLPQGFWGVSGRTPGGAWAVWVSQGEVDAAVARLTPAT